eukprot:CAMPEP_0185849874 /NCGR_PEP_ID=MMETSP1354-20130828/4221_1 /TAXON_ID=708628 /ORGANISM="Erythrolobus madagascarensis, Strain CCMP3276" /LENGTH=215 /DNA_ID=CAMNT_0028550477 /DNA_START=163 /DNA_END=810 /DNA_ORIENTATION=+
MVVLSILSTSAFCDDARRIRHNNDEDSVRTTLMGAESSELELPVDGAVSLAWSLLFRGVRYTQALDDAITGCFDAALADARAGEDAVLEQFTPVSFFNHTQPMIDGVLVQYSTNVNSDAEASVAALIIEYSTANGELSRCSKVSAFDLAIDPTVIADGGQGLFASLTEWVFAIMAGAFLSALVLGGLWFLLSRASKKTTYDLADYAVDKECDMNL